ncbi:MAG TPA: histidine triad nucleotide-binding protein [Gammaproteobacteria bacterium]|jgi:histidine triad (HIT) family protein
MSDCLFCRMVAGEIKPDLVHEDADLIAFRDIAPQAPTHVLIVPRRHIASLDTAKPADAELLGKLLLAAQKIARQEGIAASGYRTVNNCNADAGQSVFHIHVHLLGGRKLITPFG